MFVDKSNLLSHNKITKGDKNMNIYDFVVKDAELNDVPLSNYKGKVLLIVNTATGCGYTPQYNELERIYRRYKDVGFEILDFPCNQFAGQAPGSNKEISDFCEINFGRSFKQFNKIDVNGKNQEPLFKFLKSKQKGIGGSIVKWNFTKFLVDSNGEVVARFAPNQTPESFVDKITELL